ncbi:MAG: LysR family transcriptional regulator [Clostridia bacterium]|nr:LysR family transcriptional regulator [Clostridia bacterium]
MELRLLRYFVTVAEEESISRAAARLHITQPTLSRQIRDLEEELGCRLLIRSRSRHKVVPTEQGRLLLERAREILSLSDRLKSDFAQEGPVRGEVAIGGGETQGMRLLAQTAADLHRICPGIRFHVYSGNASFVADRMEKGLIDLGVLVGETDLAKYDYLPLPVDDVWGLVMRPDHPLCARASVSREDLSGVPLIVSQQTMTENELAGWSGGSLDQLQIVATYNLLYNAALLVESGLGLALALDKLAGPELAFRPLEPRLRARLNLVWLRHRTLSPAVQLFLGHLRQRLTQHVDEQ